MQSYHAEEWANFKVLNSKSALSISGSSPHMAETSFDMADDDDYDGDDGVGKVEDPLPGTEYNPVSTVGDAECLLGARSVVC